jgi:superfamily II DNA or RNA helicase
MQSFMMLEKQVPAEVRRRGDIYYQTGAVSITSMDAEFVHARVRGGSTYEVDLEVTGDRIVAHCTCPYVEDAGTVCKHIWATFRAASTRGFPKAGNSRNYRLTLDNGWGDEDGEDELPPTLVYPRKSAPPPKRQAPRVNWKDQLAELSRAIQATPAYGNQPKLTGDRQLLYVIDLEASQRAQKLILEVAFQERKKSGEWSKPRAESLSSTQIEKLDDPTDRKLLSILAGAEKDHPYNYYSGYYGSDSSLRRFRASGPLLETILPLLASTDRVCSRLDDHPPTYQELKPDLDPPWKLTVGVSQDAPKKKWVLSGDLRRDGQTLDFSKTILLLPGLVLWDGFYGRLEDGGAAAWAPILKRQGSIAIPTSQSDELLRSLLELPRLPRMELPDELQFVQEKAAPRPLLKLMATKSHYRAESLIAELSFDYAGNVVRHLDAGRGVFQPDGKRFFVRDPESERLAQQRLFALGAHFGWAEGKQALQFRTNQLAKVVRELVAEGWKVEAEGKLYRQAGEFKLDLKSGQDWFDLNARVDFEGKSVPLPRLLAAMNRRESTVVLDDGTLGMVPEEWLKKYGLVASMGAVSGDSIRFSKTQVGVLDALLASRPEVTFDEQFAQARDQLQRFQGVAPVNPPHEFEGKLREYQREGLGWLNFLRDFGFGGCLADDMGLGKTVQVLALLAKTRSGPALVVVPRSLIFNWKQEAAKFVPTMKVLDHTGTGRDRTGASFQDYDLILTTYGTLRNDAAAFSAIRFDTCILDESQAAKNASTETAKAVRLINAGHRLALSGTPVENHLGELWTLFDFLNPGMLGHGILASTGNLRNPDPATRDLLARALRPYILRRTKDQVAKDLPAKTEQTVYCDLEAEQRELYDELREHYRQSLLPKIDAIGLKKSKIQILEALLRLRQAACHPGLIDKTRTEESSAKLDLLLPQLKEITESGHKALVFSQFTSLLSIVRSQLDAEGVTYEYLDGRTRDREARVERFQNDPECRLFLVSLKAGGVGLNLTAAEYVFLLDPWWNPAVEAQAIDRSHRIGQTKAVFAYRLIARNTVEEKVLALQESKRQLADAILGGDGRLITDLKREDLELLLS